MGRGPQKSKFSVEGSTQGDVAVGQPHLA